MRYRRPPRAIACVCALLLGVGWIGPRARAQPGTDRPALRLVLGPCDVADVEGVRQLLALELGATLLPDGASSSGAAAEIIVQCDFGFASISVDDLVTGKSLRRRVALDETQPRARDRLLAIAIAELVFASWSELVAEPAPVVPAVGVTVSPLARRTTRAWVKLRGSPPAPAWHLTMGLLGRVGYQGEGAALGGGMRFVAEHGSGLGVAIDVTADRSRGRAAAGDVGVERYGIGAALHARTDRGSFALRGGVGMRLDVVRLEGRPDDPSQVMGDSVVGVVAGPVGVAGISVPLPAPVVVDLGTEVGVAALSIRGRTEDGSRVADQRFWIVAQLMVGATW